MKKIMSSALSFLLMISVANFAFASEVVEKESKGVMELGENGSLHFDEYGMKDGLEVSFRVPVTHTIHTQFKSASWSFDQEAGLFLNRFAAF